MGKWKKAINSGKKKRKGGSSYSSPLGHSKHRKAFGNVGTNKKNAIQRQREMEEETKARKALLESRKTTKFDDVKDLFSGYQK